MVQLFKRLFITANIFYIFLLFLSVQSYSNPSRYRALDLDISSRYNTGVTDNYIKLTTGIYQFSSENALVGLYSMVHIADKSYFESIKNTMEEYDIVLYELITDDKNCYCTDGSDFKRQLNTEISSSETERLAVQYQLENQVSLYNSIYKNSSLSRRNNWYIADLSIREIMRLEAPRRKMTLASFRSSRFAGRGWSERLLRNFFLSDVALITTLRYLSWLAPSPEFSCLLLDWSR